MQLLLRRVVGLAGITRSGAVCLPSDAGLSLWRPLAMLGLAVTTADYVSTAAKTDHQEEDSCPSMKYSSSFIASFP